MNVPTDLNLAFRATRCQCEGQVINILMYRGSVGGSQDSIGGTVCAFHKLEVGRGGGEESGVRLCLINTKAIIHTHFHCVINHW